MDVLRRAIVLGIVLWASALAFAQEEDEFEPVDLPPSLAERIAALAPEKIAFLRGPDVLSYAERHELLFARLERKSDAEIEAYIDAMMRVTELVQFDPGAR